MAPRRAPGHRPRCYDAAPAAGREAGTRATRPTRAPSPPDPTRLRSLAAADLRRRRDSRRAAIACAGAGTTIPIRPPRRTTSPPPRRPRAGAAPGAAPDEIPVRGMVSVAIARGSGKVCSGRTSRGGLPAGREASKDVQAGDPLRGRPPPKDALAVPDRPVRGDQRAVLASSSSRRTAPTYTTGSARLCEHSRRSRRGTRTATRRGEQTGQRAVGPAPRAERATALARRAPRRSSKKRKADFRFAAAAAGRRAAVSTRCDFPDIWFERVRQARGRRRRPTTPCATSRTPRRRRSRSGRASTSRPRRSGSGPRAVRPAHLPVGRRLGREERPAHRQAHRRERASTGATSGIENKKFEPTTLAAESLARGQVVVQRPSHARQRRRVDVVVVQPVPALPGQRRTRQRQPLGRIPRRVRQGRARRRRAPTRSASRCAAAVPQLQGERALRAAKPDTHYKYVGFRCAMYWTPGRDRLEPTIATAS